MSVSFERISAVGVERSTTLLRAGSNCAFGPMNEPSTPKLFVVKPNSTVLPEYSSSSATPLISL